MIYLLVLGSCAFALWLLSIAVCRDESSKRSEAKQHLEQLMQNEEVKLLEEKYRELCRYLLTDLARYTRAGNWIDERKLRAQVLRLELIRHEILAISQDKQLYCESLIDERFSLPLQLRPLL